MNVVCRTQPTEIASVRRDPLLRVAHVRFEGTDVFGRKFVGSVDPASALILSGLLAKAALDLSPALTSEVTIIIAEVDARDGR
jgi:hypothetical protein